jgi:hypothetical protein
LSAQWRHFGSDEARPAAYFGVGFASPVNPVARQLDTGWSLAGGVGVTTNYLGVMLDATFADFGLNHTTLNRVGVPRGDEKYWAVTVNPIFHVNQRGPVDFYVTAGGGLYSRITEFRGGSDFGGPFSRRNDLLASDTLYKPGVNGGAGFAFNLGYSRVKIFAEARFHHMFTRDAGASFIPVTVGVRF